MFSVRLRSIVLPVEHGGWALVGAPLLLGLLVAPSVAGGALGISVLATFLGKQPFHIAATDWRRGRRYPRTPWAEGVVAVLAALAFAGVGVAWRASPHPFATPLIVAAPLAAVQVWHELQGHGRSTLAQLSGAMAAAMTAAAIAIAGGWPTRLALGLSLLMGLQSVSAIVYVGTRLRRARAGHASDWPAWVLHVFALAVATVLVFAGETGRAAIIVFAILTVRAFVGLRPGALPTRTVLVGVQEIGFSALTVVGLWLAARYGW